MTVFLLNSQEIHYKIAYVIISLDWYRYITPLVPCATLYWYRSYHRYQMSDTSVVKRHLSSVVLYSREVSFSDSNLLVFSLS